MENVERLPLPLDQLSGEPKQFLSVLGPNFSSLQNKNLCLEVAPGEKGDLCWQVKFFYKLPTLVLGAAPLPVIFHTGVHFPSVSSLSQRTSVLICWKTTG